MEKLLVLLFIFISMFILTSCSDNNDLPEEFRIVIEGEYKVGIWKDHDITYYNGDNIICFDSYGLSQHEYKCFISDDLVIEEY